MRKLPKLISPTAQWRHNKNLPKILSVSKQHSPNSDRPLELVVTFHDGDVLTMDYLPPVQGGRFVLPKFLLAAIRTHGEANFKLRHKQHEPKANKA